MKPTNKTSPRTVKSQRSSRAAEIQANHAQQEERNAFFRRFGYDQDAAVKFVLSKALPLSGPVLDIGTGKGRFVVALAPHVARVTTVDISAAEQRYARLEAAYAGVTDRIRFLARDAAKLPWRKARFDAVVSMKAIHHLEDPDAVLAEMLRVLRPGGKLVLADFSVGGFRVMDVIHRAEGRTHPHPPSRFLRWKARLRSQGFRVKHFRDRHHEVLVAGQPLRRIVGAKPAVSRPARRPNRLHR
jgi:ubiquinone/menaquinone biosynthesis C-methylase UbiE